MSLSPNLPSETPSPLLIHCRSCQHHWKFETLAATCPVCGQDWLDVSYDLAAVAPRWKEKLGQRGASLWRYRELLPIQDGRFVVSLGEGWTPLLRAENLGLMLGHQHIYIKDERQGPTRSFKDRQAAVAVSMLKEAGIKEVVVASTGNVAIAYSAYCARAGIKLWAFLSSSVPAEKMREVALYGSEVIKVAGTYDQAKQVAAEFAAAKNIFLDRGVKAIAAKEAMKTMAFEIAEQLGAIEAHADPLDCSGRYPWRVPDWFLQSVSGGLGPVGVMKGFAELHEMGLIGRLPKLACIQAAGCAPMVTAFQQGLPEPADVLLPQTAITTLATGRPGRAYEVLRQHILQYGGTMETVTDAETYHALKTVAQLDGLSVEPATAATFAGLFKLIQQKVIQPHEVVVVNATGHTLPVASEILGQTYAYDLPYIPQSDGLLMALEALGQHIQRVAIVDDNADARRLIRRILQAQREFVIDEAPSGPAGLQLIRETKPNLVILDLMMPGLNGFDVVRALKADPELQHIPIIVVTAKELTAVEQRQLEGKIASLLQKGRFLSTDLLQNIDTLTTN